MKPQSAIQSLINTEVRTRFGSLLGRFSRFLGVLLAIALLIYIGLVAWLHHDISGKAVSITQAAGLPATVESAFRGFLPFLVAAVILNSLIRLGLEALNPFAKTSSVLPKLFALILLSVAGGMLPPMLRTLRSVDASGHPVSMQPSDPLQAAWFAPDGTAVLFHSAEDDGMIRFWNRPGITPDSGVPCNQVTREVRKAWQRAVDEKTARAKEQKEATRRAEEESSRMAAAAKHERDLQLAAQRESQALRESQAREAAARTALNEAVARASQARKLAEEQQARAAAEQARANAENARAAKLAEEQEQLRNDLRAAREQERKQEVAKAHASSRPASASAASADSGWKSITLSPGVFYTTRGRAGSQIEVRSNGRGACLFPDGKTSVPFGSGSSSFRNPHAECRFVCWQNGPLQVSFRWTMP